VAHQLAPDDYLHLGINGGGCLAEFFAEGEIIVWSSITGSFFLFQRLPRAEGE
jgi:hypothetical protein